MSTIDKNNLVVSSTKENIFAKILVIGTGKDVGIGDMNDLLFLHTRDGDYSSISTVIEAYMDKKLKENGGDVSKTVAQLLTNATGESVTSEQASSYVQTKKEAGIITWTDMFAHLIDTPNTAEGAKLDSNVKNLLKAYGIAGNNQGSGIDSTILPPADAAKFVDPALSNDQKYKYFEHIVVYDKNSNPLKSFTFDAPKVLFTATANVFDFAGGDKTLAIPEHTYNEIFGLGKDTIFLNFSAGDKVVIIDDSSVLGNIVSLNENQAKFYNTVHTVDTFIDAGDPTNGFFKEGDSLISISSLKQYDGSLTAAPIYGMPQELVSLADAYGTYFPGVSYDLNLKDYDLATDGTILLVGTNPTLLNASNFIFNSPEFTV